MLSPPHFKLSVRAEDRLNLGKLSGQNLPPVFATKATLVCTLTPRMSSCSGPSTKRLLLPNCSGRAFRSDAFKPKVYPSKLSGPSSFRIWKAFRQKLTAETFRHLFGLSSRRVLDESFGPLDELQDSPPKSDSERLRTLPSRSRAGSLKRFQLRP